jgi:hypothetical protein
MLCRNHVKNLTLSGAPLTLCLRRYGTPRIAIVTYYLLRDYPNCAPSPCGAALRRILKDSSHPHGSDEPFGGARGGASFH